MEIKKGTKVFVTGGNGFLGSWLLRALLARGASVTCLICEDLPGSIYTRDGLESRVTVVRGRIEDDRTVSDLLKRERFDVVFHLAAQPIVPIANAHPVGTFIVNIKGTWDLLEACRVGNTPRAIVVASTDKVYGSSQTLPYTENTPLNGEHPYDVSKSATDLLSKTYAVSYGLPIAITRCGNLIGGGDLNTNRIVPDTILALLSGKQPVIRSDGKYTRDYIDVEDAATAYLLVGDAVLSKQYKGEAFNIAPGKPATVLEVVNELITISGRTDLQPIIKNIATNEIREQYLDATKIQKELGWKPRYTLRETLEKAYLWYKENPL